MNSIVLGLLCGFVSLIKAQPLPAEPQGSTNPDSGWVVIKDRQGACQISVPADWKLSTTPGYASAPDGRTDAQVQGSRTAQSFAELKAAIGEGKKWGGKFVEDTPKRFWFVFEIGRSPTLLNWLVALEGNPICHAKFREKLRLA